MIDFERGLYVSIVQRDQGPHPLPLDSGFSDGYAYRVIGIYNPSESGECWLVLANDLDQMWYISQRHARTHALIPEARSFRIPLDGARQPLALQRA